MNAVRLVRNSFPSTEQSILRTRKPRCPSRIDRASRRTLSRPAARCSSPRPHPCSSMPRTASSSFPFAPFFTVCLPYVPLLNPCVFASLSLSLSLFSSLLFSSLFCSPFAVSRSTRNTTSIHTRCTLFSPTGSDSRDSLQKVDDIARVHTLALRNFGETLSSSLVTSAALESAR